LQAHQRANAAGRWRSARPRALRQLPPSRGCTPTRRAGVAPGRMPLRRQPTMTRPGLQLRRASSLHIGGDLRALQPLAEPLPLLSPALRLSPPAHTRTCLPRRWTTRAAPRCAS
jgi:hypothetical protein